MRVRCFASSESRTPPPSLGQEDERLLNGQHQLHRGEDGPHPGQHHHQEGEDQAGPGELVHHPGQEHHVSGLLHHHQREDQDLAGQRLLQQGHHHHLVPESLLPQTQDALDEGGPRFRVGGTGAERQEETAASCYSIWTGSGPAGGKTWIKFTSGVLTFFVYDGFIRETGWRRPWQRSSCSHGRRRQAS